MDASDWTLYTVATVRAQRKVKILGELKEKNQMIHLGRWVASVVLIIIH